MVSGSVGAYLAGVDGLLARGVAARDRGVNLAFLGANEGYRHMRFGSTPLGPDRLEIDYKSFHEDPMSATNPMDATQELRRFRLNRRDGVRNYPIHGVSPVGLVPVRRW